MGKNPTPVLTTWNPKLCTCTQDYVSQHLLGTSANDACTFRNLCEENASSTVAEYGSHMRVQKGCDHWQLVLGYFPPTPVALLLHYATDPDNAKHHVQD